MQILAQVPYSVSCAGDSFNTAFRNALEEIQEKQPPGCQVLLHTMVFNERSYTYNMVFNIVAIQRGSVSQC